MKEERKVKIEKMEPTESVEGILFCRVTFEKEMTQEEMQQNKGRGSIDVTHWTKNEAASVYHQLHKLFAQEGRPPHGS